MTTIEDVQAFHERVIKNRLLHLEREITDATQRIVVRDEEAQGLDSRRREIMKVLSSHGAIDQMSRLLRTQLRGRPDLLRPRVQNPASNLSNLVNPRSHSDPHSKQSTSFVLIAKLNWVHEAIEFEFWFEFVAGDLV